MIVKEGYPIVRALIISIMLMALLHFYVSSAILVLFIIIAAFLLLFCLNFFRDPKRIIPQDKNVFVSPADGKIVQIKKISDPDIGDSHLISIFLNVFNVHVNRAHFSGVVQDVQYKKGKFLAAFNHDASDENEQSLIYIKSNLGIFKVKQIAGLIARRIFCYLKINKEIKIGEKIGFIMFGSRVDIIIKENIDLNIKMGQKVIGGETIIGKLNEDQISKSKKREKKV